ncbi:MAG: hypothetical protein MUE49_05935 [Rhodospirillales bacterium]|jgi:hypothetical protein|nr:hypothetical protein [Rhodospirillales bacterium]
MRRAIADMWHGRVPLGRAFWSYAVILGLFINVTASLVSLAVIAADGPAALALAIHFAPLPWIIVTAVGVWRSAGRPEVTPDHGQLARAGVVLWSLLLLLI